MQISFNLSSVFSHGSSPVENAEVLRALLECLIAINIAYLEEHPKTIKLYDTRVVYGRTDDWDSLPDLYTRGYGDCKTLTAVRCAELRLAGSYANPTFRFQEFPEGMMYHILIETGPDTYEDPSKVKGMNQDENAYFHD